MTDITLRKMKETCKKNLNEEGMCIEPECPLYGEDKHGDKYCLVFLSPSEWDIDAIEQAIKEAEKDG